MKAEFEKRENAAREMLNNVAKHNAAIEHVNNLALEDAIIERKSKLSAIQIADFAEKQTQLLEEANALAKSADHRAAEAEKETKSAKRHAVFANIIALISLAIATIQYLASNGI